MKTRTPHGAETNDLPLIGYHYVTTDDPATQARTWTANNGGPVAMLDWEANGGSLANLIAAAMTVVYFTPNADHGVYQAISRAAHNRVSKRSALSIRPDSLENSWTAKHAPPCTPR
ncbi:hypothetical protein KIH27_10740 [Mycobacterium sp. M1]|uniref:Uncharacterized protein n=1 Tax=Mycolicibacter acidiphilus TaxID=2835306 RepID=A0ABS5RIE3_9MYCO|nr:hypothetical protein [Mycolicibacter acidiphilus]MBS9534060.1 hypothetical protein [Mycolicibacter acidiphilus]